MDLTKEKSNLMKAGAMVLIIISVYFLIRVVSEIKSYRYIGGGAPASNTITFEGMGEVFAAPDMATVSFTIREEAKVLKDAQTKATTKEAAVLKYLKDKGIEEKDIKTENYSSYPKYEYQSREIMMYPSFPGKQVITGYEVSEYVTVKVRDIEKAGDLLSGVGALGVGELSGPNFTVENEDALKAQARKLAIAEAKAKAKTLAEDLDVRLVRIVSFSENGNYPGPMYYAKDAVRLEAGAASNPAPELPTGENKIVSNVSITYEIR